MSDRRFQRMQALFTAAASLPREDWRWFLAQSTGDDPQIVEEVLQLLERHAEGESRFLAGVRAGVDFDGAVASAAPQSSEAVPIGPMQDPLLEKVPSIEGYKVLGRTVLLERVGSGGMGIVYRGWHLTFRIEVGVKIMKPSMAADPLFVARFRREAESALKLTHQNVVRVYDVEERHGLQFLVMEFVDGESVPARIQRWGRMRQREAVTMITGVAAGLAEAHAHGLVHRDIKPDNLLLSRSGRVKLADLGLVRLERGADHVTLTGGSRAIIGTPQYMPPEQWEGPHVGPEADVWALGATLFFLLTGEHGVPRLPTMQIGRWIHENPFPSLRDRLPDLRPELSAIFERCVQPRPQDRFRNGGELFRALAALGMHDETLLKEEEYRVGRRDQAGDASLTPAIIARIETRLNGLSTPVRRRRLARSGRSSGVSVLAVAAIVLCIGVAAALYVSRTSREAAAEDVGATAAAAAPAPRERSASKSPASPVAPPAASPVASPRASAAVAPTPAPPGAAHSTPVVAPPEPAKAMLAKPSAAVAPSVGRGDRLPQPILDPLFDDGSPETAPMVRGVAVGATQVEVQVDGHPALPAVQVDGAGRFAAALPADVDRAGSVAVTAIQEGNRSLPTKAPVRDLIKAPKIAWLEPAIGVELPESVRVQVKVTSLEPVDAVEIAGVKATRAEPAALDTWFADVSVPKGKGACVEVTATASGKTRSLTSARLGVGLVFEPIETTLGMVMRPIPGSQYRFGDPATKKNPLLPVEPFWMAENEVSRGDWRALGMTDPSPGADDRMPVAGVTFADAKIFCQRLHARERDAGRLPKGYGYALPTEARWEYACRGGSSGPYGIDTFAYTLLDSAPRVDDGKWNAWHLRNMHGGVAEWCADSVPVEDLALNILQQHPDYTGYQGRNREVLMAVRGGAWTDFPEDVTSFARVLTEAKRTRRTNGLRVALVPLPAPK